MMGSVIGRSETQTLENRTGLQHVGIAKSAAD